MLVFCPGISRTKLDMRTFARTGAPHDGSQPVRLALFVPATFAVENWKITVRTSTCEVSMAPVKEEGRTEGYSRAASGRTREEPRKQGP